jgi:hypothetical protein
MLLIIIMKTFMAAKNSKLVQTEISSNLHQSLMTLHDH